MLSSTPGTGCFVQVPDGSDKCILHPIVIQEFNQDTYTVELKEFDAAPLESGQDIFVYYDFKNEFMRQPASIGVIVELSSGFTFTFQFTGDAVSAERRQCYRVSTVMADVSSTFGEEDNCEVVDISATGFAVIAARQYKITEIIVATIQFEGMMVNTQCRIESVQELSNGRIRYGLHCLDGKTIDERQSKGLQQIFATIQRQQLRRMSQAG